MENSDDEDREAERLEQSSSIERNKRNVPASVESTRQRIKHAKTSLSHRKDNDDDDDDDDDWFSEGEHFAEENEVANSLALQEDSNELQRNSSMHVFQRNRTNYKNNTITVGEGGMNAGKSLIIQYDNDEDHSEIDRDGEALQKATSKFGFVKHN